MHKGQTLAILAHCKMHFSWKTWLQLIGPLRSYSDISSKQIPHTSLGWSKRMIDVAEEEEEEEEEEWQVEEEKEAESESSSESDESKESA